MKSLQELEAIRNETLDSMNLRKEHDGVRIVVGMATCGIAAGARPVLLKIMEEVQKRNLSHVVVAQTGCIGLCRLEPIVEVFKPGQEKVTYVKMTPELASKVVAEHIVNDNVVESQTIGKFQA
jgi:NADP-reducing hydrogenase subunit HndB